MKLLCVRKENEPYFTKEFIHGYNTGAKNQYDADAAEVKQGQWIYIQDEEDKALYECSECQHFNIHAKSLKVPYCWFCGAKMSEVEE